DHRSDLWSMAVIVFRAITGVKPFHGSTIADLVVKLCIDPLPVATRAARDLPPAIDAFFERAFARDPEQRFASAPEMAAAFEAGASSSMGGGAGVEPAPRSFSQPFPAAAHRPAPHAAASPTARFDFAAPAVVQPEPTPGLTATPPSGSGAQPAFVP